MSVAALDWQGRSILSPLTKGGNLPFRRLCVSFGAEVTVSEMAYARQLLRRRPPEMALLKSHPSETQFGVQLAVRSVEDGVRAGELAIERGARFVDINCGCPIHDVVRRGMGSALLRREGYLLKLAEGLAEALPVPVTAKIRIGWSESKITGLELSRKLAETGIAALTVHGRTREQRYTKAADWNLIGAIAEAVSIPVVGNGDILTWYEAEDRLAASGCAAAMVARGALIKPWIFRELKEKRCFLPDAAERVGIYRKLCDFMREHLGADARGRKKAMFFLPWHFSLFCRYRPFPEAEWRDRSREHPLLQTRDADDQELPDLEQVLRCPDPEIHKRIAAIVYDAESDGEACDRLASLVGELPTSADQAELPTGEG